MKQIFIMLFFLLSCDTSEEINLYDSSDYEYSYLQALAAEKCIEQASIFDALDLSGDFENSAQLDKIYKITQDSFAANSMFIKVSAVTATQMTLIVNSFNSVLRKVITFEQADHDALLAHLELVSCSLLYSANFSASNLGGADTMSLVWRKESISVQDGDDDNTEADSYQRQIDSLVFNRNYPLFFYFYNGTKQVNIKLDSATDEKTGTSTLAISEVTSSGECNAGDASYNEFCAFSDTSEFASCDIVVSTASETYLRNSFGDDFIFMSGTGCEMLNSGQI